MGRINIYAARQGLYTVYCDGKHAGIIQNERKDGRLSGRWKFYAQSRESCECSGPLKRANGIDVTSIVHHNEKLELRLLEGAEV